MYLSLYFSFQSRMLVAECDALYVVTEAIGSLVSPFISRGMCIVYTRLLYDYFYKHKLLHCVYAESYFKLHCLFRK